MRKITLTAAALLAALSGSAFAQANYPERPVMLVVPYAAGGPVDTIARIIAVRMSELLGQQVVIENVGGAGGLTGASRVAKAAPDGYTVLLSGSAVLAQIPNFYKQRPPYDPLADFEHVALFSDSARVLVARKDFPPNDFKEFIAYAKANQDKMQYGSAGAGSGSHTCAILLDGAMGTKVTHVPYRGAGPAMQDLMGGRIDYITEQISTATPQIKGGTAEGLCDARPRPRARPGKHPDRRSARHEGARLRRLGHLLGAQGHAEGDRRPACQGVERRDRYARGGRALQGHRRRGRRQGPPLAGIHDAVRQIRARALGGSDQGQRHRAGLALRQRTDPA